MNALRRFFFAVAVALAGSLVMVSAQDYGNGPPPEVQSQLAKARADAKTSSFNALSADHRTKVQAIVDQVNGGSLSREDGASQIDKILTPSESSAVLAQEQKMRDAMRQAFASNNGGSFSGGGAGGFGGGRRGGFGGGPGGNRQPDAGRFLLMISQPPREH